MDYDELANKSNTTTTYIRPTDPVEVHEIIFTLFQTVAVAANTIILITILNFKRLRKAPYVFVASWAISDLCSLLLLPSGLRLFAVLDNRFFSENIYCAFYQSGFIMHTATILFSIFVAIDWTMAAYCSRASKTFREWYKLVLGIIWVLIVASTIAQISVCWFLWNHYIFSIVSVIITLFLAYIVVIVIQIIRLVQKLRKRPSEYSSLGINLSTAYLGCWLLSVLHFYFILSVEINFVFVVLSLCLIYSSSIVNLVLLCCCSNEFCACVQQILKCKRVKYREDLTDPVPVQGSIVSNGVNINFSSLERLDSLANI